MTTNLDYPDGFDLDGGGFVLFAPAKINLSLRVLGRRPDGFHELDTLFQEIDWTDRLSFYPAADWQFEIRGAELSTGPENLVTRAALALSQAAGVPPTGHVVLEKDIPIGGGLGGGSSDAAVTLIGLSRLWGLNWPVERLHPLAASLGSDCAFFLYGGLARGRGRGESLELLPGAEAQNLLLVVPPYGVSTAWAFGAGRFPLTGDEKSVILEFPLAEVIPSARPGANGYNDLENIVLSAYPELAELKARLLAEGALGAMLSGSGSSVYGIFNERSQAVHAAHQFEPRFKVRVSRTVKRPRRTPAP